MMLAKLFACILVLLLTMGCGEGSSSADAFVDRLQYETHEGMVYVAARNSTVILGSNGPGVAAKEAVEMKVAFDYNFFIDEHEVTCKEYNQLVERERKISCNGGLEPASGVTYYDAILYANARSKNEDLDTSYTYSSAKFDSDGSCVYLENLLFIPYAVGYRLPTEAEWVFVARQGWNPEEGWHSGNSDFVVHPVCSMPANDLGVCDMSGNVKEWVYDWLGYFSDSTIVDYVGAPDGENLGERVVKGGCFKNSAESIQLFHRGDVYAVTSSTKANYIGFRLAYGPINDAHYMDAKDGSDESKFVVEVSSSLLKSLMGTARSKLVFRNDLNGNLAFVDFSNGIPYAQEIRDTLDSYHPDISPDGSKVAFCSGMEGKNKKSELYVRNLNSLGLGLVKLDVESAAIPRWRVLENGDTVIVYVSSAGDNSDEATFKSQSTWQVSFSDGKFGIPKKLFDGAYHGGVSLDNQMAVSGSKKLRARIDGEDQVWYNGEQACNVSLSKNGRTLFLDFASKTGKAFVGSKYSVHQRMFVADSAGRLVQSVEAPDGFSYDHSEWVGNDYAVATLTNINGAHQKIVLVNMQNGSHVDLLSGREVWHPCVWVGNPLKDGEFIKYNLDSLGVYLEDDAAGRVKILRYRMENYWRYRDSADVVILGSSRSSNGIDCRYFDDLLKPVNLSFFPSGMPDIRHMFNRYIKDAVPRLKYLVFSLDLDNGYYGENTSLFDKDYRLYPGFVYDENHNFWKDQDASPIYEATRSCIGDSRYEVFLSNKSSEFAQSTGWSSSPEVAVDSAWMLFYKENFEVMMRDVKDIAAAGYEGGFYVIAVIFPQSPGFAKTGAFGRYGLLRSSVPSIMDSLNSLSSSYPNFVVMDENKMGSHDYTDDMAQDCDHLNEKGAAQLTARLNLLLRTLN